MKCDRCGKPIPEEIAKMNQYKFWFFCCVCFEKVYRRMKN